MRRFNFPLVWAFAAQLLGLPSAEASAVAFSCLSKAISGIGLSVVSYVEFAAVHAIDTMAGPFIGGLPADRLPLSFSKHRPG